MRSIGFTEIGNVHVVSGPKGQKTASVLYCCDMCGAVVTWRTTHEDWHKNEFARNWTGF